MWVSLAVVGCLASCATGYVPKGDEATARLRFVQVNKQMSVSHFAVADTKSCPHRKAWSAGVFGAADLVLWTTSAKQVSLGMTDPPVNGQSYREVLIPVEKFAIFEVGTEVMATAYNRGYQCNIDVAFKPKKDGQYEAQYEFLGNACRIKLFELVPSPQGTITRVPEPSMKTYRSEGFMDAKAPCAYDAS